MIEPTSEAVNAGHSGARAARAAVAAEIMHRGGDGNAPHPWTLLAGLDHDERIGAFAFLVGALAESLLHLVDSDTDEALAAMGRASADIEARIDGGPDA